MEPTLKTAISNTGKQLVVVTTMSEGREAAIACVVEGRPLTVGHLFRNAKQGEQFQVIDPGTMKDIKISKWRVVEELDAAMLDIICRGPGYKPAALKVGEPVTITSVNWDRQSGRPAWNITEGRIVAKGKMNLYLRDGQQFGPEVHGQRYKTELLSQAPALCGAAVTNSEGLIVGLINGGPLNIEAPVDTLYCVSVVDVLEALKA